MIHTIKLTHKTGRGRNKINEAGNPEHWIVLREQDYVVFSEREGPWLFVRPANNMDNKERWVSTTNDPDFNVEIIR